MRSMYFRDAFFIFVATILDEEMEARGWTGPYDIVSQALRYQGHDYPSGEIQEPRWGVHRSKLVQQGRSRSRTDAESIKLILVVFIVKSVSKYSHCASVESLIIPLECGRMIQGSRIRKCSPID